MVSTRGGSNSGAASSRPVSKPDAPRSATLRTMQMRQHLMNRFGMPSPPVTPVVKPESEKPAPKKRQRSGSASRDDSKKRKPNADKKKKDKTSKDEKSAPSGSNVGSRDKEIDEMTEEKSKTKSSNPSGASDVGVEEDASSSAAVPTVKNTECASGAKAVAVQQAAQVGEKSSSCVVESGAIARAAHVGDASSNLVAGKIAIGQPAGLIAAQLGGLGLPVTADMFRHIIEEGLKNVFASLIPSTAPVTPTVAVENEHQPTAGQLSFMMRGCNLPEVFIMSPRLRGLSVCECARCVCCVCNSYAISCFTTWISFTCV